MDNSYAKDFAKKNKPQFEKYRKYILNNDWTTNDVSSSLTDSYFSDLYSGDAKKATKAEINKRVKEVIAKQREYTTYKMEEFKLQNDLIKNIINRLQYLVKKDKDHHLKAFKDFVKYSLDIIKIHTNRVEEYADSVDISKIENQEVRAEEIKMIKLCYSENNAISELIEKLGIKEDDRTDGIQWLKGQYATVAMHKDLVQQYPEIKRKLDKMGIDFESDPPQTIHILNKNPPIYNPDKDYWEQDKQVLQYWVDEYKKIDMGVTIDGFYIDGWLYFHFNHFVTKVPKKVIKGGIEESDDEIRVPVLRDNEVIIADYFIKSKKEQLMSLIAATRRAAKTTMNSSRIARAKILGKKQILCAGGSSEDLGHIHQNLDICDNNIAHALRLYFLSPTEDGRGKSYGIKTVSNKSKTTSNVFIINLEGGTSKKKKETLAGFTPDEFILDEAMKFPFKEQLSALAPALWGDGVLRCFPLITGTGGSEDLAVDAIKMLNDPKANKVCLMDWDVLDKHCAEEYRTWNRKDFGLFLPTQMCIKHPKIKSNLAEYLGIESEVLKLIPVMVTNWKEAKEKEDIERDNVVSDKKEYVKLLAYHPFDPSEIFLSGKENPFPVKEAKAHKEYLLSTGLWDRRRDIYRDSKGKITVEISKKDLAPFPYNGSNIDTPFLIFEDPPTEKVAWGTYVAGFDDYKHDSAENGSLGTFTVWKNETIGDPFSKKLVASIACRPERHSFLHEKWLLLMEAYQLEGTCFGENEDFSIKEYLDRRHLTEKYLATSLDFTQTFNLPNTLKRKFGWTPQGSKRTLLNLFIEYCQEDIEIVDEKGDIKIVKGVTRIDDIWLLEEIINYTENQNVDRIISAMGGVGYMHYLKSSYKWKVKQAQKEIKEGTYIKKHRSGFYGKSKTSFFRSIK